MPTNAVLSDCKAVLFDASGTLIVSYPAPEEALAMACRTLGLDMTRERAVEIYATVQNRCRADILATQSRGRRLSTSEKQAVWQDIFRRVCNDALPKAAERMEAEIARVEFRWRAAEDSKKVLMASRKSGRRIGMVSNFDAGLRKILADAGFMDYIDAVIVSAEVGCEKPDPRIFEAAMNALDVSAAETIHVGDDAFDVVGAAAAGIRPVWLSVSGDPWKVPPGSNVEPAAVIRRLLDLMPLLGIVTE